jgi:hypothetical protein
VWLRLNPSSLLKLSGCSLISIASLTRRSMYYLVAVLSLEVLSKVMWWYVVRSAVAVQQEGSQVSICDSYT